MKIKAYLMMLFLPMIHVAPAAVIFSEDFDSYTAGNLNGQGDWTVNVAGTMTVVNAPSVAYSSPNYMTVGGGGAVQHNFSSIDLTAEATSLSFYFLSDTTTAGRNIQLSLRAATSGSASVFYLNLLGNGSGLQAGVSSSSYSSYSFTSALATGSWYLFSATTDPQTDQLAFNVTQASGGSALTSGTVDISGTALTAARLVFSSNSSTAAGDWAIDNVSVVAVPEPNAAALILGALGIMALRYRSSIRKRQLR